MDKIILTKIEFYAYHGVLEEEKRLGQKFQIDLEVHLDLSKAGQTDDVKHTLNYVGLYDVVKQTAQIERYDLLETIGEKIASRLLEKYPQIQTVRVKVIKPTPPIEGILAGTAIEIERSRAKQ